MESKKEENEPQTDRQDSKTTFLQIHFLKKNKKKLAKFPLIAYNKGHGDIAQLGEHLLDV